MFAAMHAAAKPIEDKKWLEARCPNFSIIGARDKDYLVEVCRDAEVFRSALLAVTGIEPSPHAPPTQVFLIPNEQFQDLTGHDNWTAMSARNRWGDITIVLDSAVVRKTQAVWHEYVRTILNGRLGIDYPLWYSEGLAEYFASSISFQGTFTIGKPNLYHLRRFHRRSLIEPHELLTSTAFANLDENERASFYSWSWLLVHFLQHSTRREVPVKDGLNRYYEARLSGKEEIDSFVGAFRIQPDDLRGRLMRYGERECCDYLELDEEVLVGDVPTELRRLPREEVILELGRIAVAMGHVELAENWLAMARGDEKTRARALALSATLQSQAGDFSAASDLLGKAVSIAPDDPYIQIEHAHFLMEQYKRSGEAKKLADIYAAQNALAKAWSLDKSLAASYALTGETYLLLGGKPERAVELLEQAVTLRPTERGYRNTLATAYYEAGDSESAMAMARSLANWAHGEDEVTETARQLLDKIEERNNESD